MDADWAENIDDQRSMGGFLIFFGKNLVAWSAKKQPTIAQSSKESKFSILANVTVE